MTGETRAGDPRISVIVEGYNESLDLGSAEEVVEALRSQRYHRLDEVEVLLVGSSEQCAAWSRRFDAGEPFFAVTALAADGEHYYALKNRGAEAARGAILAFLDSDVVPDPQWLASLVSAVEDGADAVGGVSLFRGEDGRPPHHPLLQVAASISWGFVLGEDAGDGLLCAEGFLNHNVGFRTRVFEQTGYREDLGRTCAGAFLHGELVGSGARVVIHPRQIVAHVFDERWWLTSLHHRFGYEVHRLKRLRGEPRHGWVTRLPWVEPLLTMAWHVVLDLRRWWRFAGLAGIARTRRLALYPLLLLTSLLARGSEAVAMYRTRLRPREMEAFARTH